MAVISKQHEELFAALEAVRAKVTATRVRSEMTMRGKYEQKLDQMIDLNTPLLTLSEVQFPSSVAGIQQSFNKVCKNRNLKNLSVLEIDGEKLLVNFDADEAETALEDHLLRKQGIDPKVLREEAAKLDAEFRGTTEIDSDNQ